MAQECKQIQLASLFTVMPSLSFLSPSSDLDWESLWAPYDQGTYTAAMDLLEPSDVVLDIGAGDLRFARQAATSVRKVFAIERNPEVLASRPRGAEGDPANLTVVCADALSAPFPEGITTGILLMRHCCHFKAYISRLRAAGCRWLITNARWGMDVERIPLGPQPSFGGIPGGWYACVCGAVGFKAALPEGGSEGLEKTISVEDCPACLSSRMDSGMFHGRDR